MIDVHEPVGSHDHEFASQSAKSSVVVSKQEIMQSGLEERHELARLLRGQQLRIPDLHRIFQGWPEAINVDIAALRIDVDQTLESLFPPGKRLSKLKAADFAVFGAMWWPYASPERLRISTYLAIWLFIWDDETDSLEFSELATNLEEAQAIRATSLDRMRMLLALDCTAQDKDEYAIQIGSYESKIELFAPVGHAMIKNCSLKQRQALMRELELYIKMTELEQRVQLSARLPSLELYNHYRMGSGAVGVLVAIHEYALGTHLPDHVVNSPAMNMLWDATNVNISVVNDILSLKKEIAQNQVDTLIPLLFIAHEHDLQAAMDDATETLKDSVTRLELAANALLEDNAGDKLVKADLAKFIDSCRYACTGNLNFSLQSKRYQLNVENVHGGITITI